MKIGLLSNKLHEIRTNLVKKYIKGDVLDLGCGPANNYRIGRSKIKSYYGVEYDKNLIKKNKKHFPKAKFFRKDLDEDKLNLNKQFDAIIMLALVEHIFNIKHLFKEAKSHLKDDGIIVITTPTPFGNDIVHKIGSSIGLFSKVAADDHIIIFNKKRFEILANEMDLKITAYRSFELGCNQLVIMRKKKY